MEAVSQAYLKIASGRCDVVVAGGVESMSQMQLIYNKEMTELFRKKDVVTMVESPLPKDVSNKQIRKEWRSDQPLLITPDNTDVMNSSTKSFVSTTSILPTPRNTISQKSTTSTNKKKSNLIIPPRKSQKDDVSVQQMLEENSDGDTEFKTPNTSNKSNKSNISNLTTDIKTKLNIKMKSLPTVSSSSSSSSVTAILPNTIINMKGVTLLCLQTIRDKLLQSNDNTGLSTPFGINWEEMDNFDISHDNSEGDGYHDNVFPRGSQRNATSAIASGKSTNTTTKETESVTASSRATSVRLANLVFSGAYASASANDGEVRVIHTYRMFLIFNPILILLVLFNHHQL